MSPIKRLLRRVPCLRWCALQYANKVRRNRQDATWAETQLVLVAIGNMTLSWAGINLILNTFIEAHHNQRGKPIRNDLPRDFTAKLEYIKKVERDPEWHPERLAELREMRLALGEMNKKRVMMTHGLAFRRGYGPAWNIHVAKEEGDNLMRQDVPHSAQDFHLFALEVSQMGGRMSRFFMPMLRQE